MRGGVLVCSACGYGCVGRGREDEEHGDMNGLEMHFGWV